MSSRSLTTRDCLSLHRRPRPPEGKSEDRRRRAPSPLQGPRLPTFSPRQSSSSPIFQVHLARSLPFVCGPWNRSLAMMLLGGAMRAGIRHGPGSLGRNCGLGTSCLPVSQQFVLGKNWTIPVLSISALELPCPTRLVSALVTASRWVYPKQHPPLFTLGRPQ